MMRKLFAVILAAVLLSLTTGASTSAQEILPDPPSCTQCWQTWLPAVFGAEVQP